VFSGPDPAAWPKNQTFGRSLLKTGRHYGLRAIRSHRLVGEGDEETGRREVASHRKEGAGGRVW